MTATGKLSVTELEARYLSGGTKAIRDYYVGCPILVILPDDYGKNSVTWTPHESDSSVAKPVTPVSGESSSVEISTPRLPPGSVITPVRGKTPRFVVVGRNDDCDIKINHNTVSRRHAVFDVYGPLTLEDLQSKNGTFIDGVMLDPGRPTSVCSPRELRFGGVSALLLDLSTLLDVCRA